MEAKEKSEEWETLWETGDVHQKEPHLSGHMPRIAVAGTISFEEIAGGNRFCQFGAEGVVHSADWLGTVTSQKPLSNLRFFSLKTMIEVFKKPPQAP